MEYTVCEKDKCCGCNACVNICPKKCIKIEDKIKLLNAVIDKNVCINCKMCENVCQVVNSKSDLIKLNPTTKCYEGVTKNDDINKKSSSGGFATTVGYEFAKNGGYVVGVKSDRESFYFDITNNPEDVKLFAGSKYVKVLTGDIYKKIKEKLINKQNVLFVGVPCQVAGLKMYLQKEYENLFLIDLICHGTPSEKVLLKYLNEKGIDNSMNVAFRKKHQMQLFKNNQSILPKTVCDPYMAGFLNGLFYTENCYKCRYAQSERVSDITIGDSWGSKIEGKDGMDNLSLILCNNAKSEYLLSLVNDYFKYLECDYENARNHNHQLVGPSLKQPYTDYYFEHFNDKTTKAIVNKAYPKMMIKQKIKYVLVKLHLR